MSRKDFKKIWERLQIFAKTFGDEGSYYERGVKHGKRIYCAIDGQRIHFQIPGTPGEIKAYRNFVSQTRKTLMSVGMYDEFNTIKFLTHEVISDDGSSSNERNKEIVDLLREIYEETEKPYKVKISYMRRGQEITYDRYYRWGVREDHSGLRTGWFQILVDEYKNIKR
jgi:hypothetical protein|tara:strand:+ start:524 stop:1027 length:504 start_codon:yes stop_codon:yes gene_type:complete